MASLIEVENVVKRFGSFEAVKSVSLCVEQGSFVSLLGPSGCGKTTMLNLIAGFLRPDAGAIRIAGRDAGRDPPHRRNLGMVFQNYALFPHLTVYENVCFGLRVRDVPQAEARERVHRALDLVKLRDFVDRHPRQLSGGQRQRVALARAIVIEPVALLLDEPLSALDASLRDEMRTELREIQRNTGITMVFVTHDQGEALSMSDRVVVMNHGRVEQFGGPSDIYDRPTSRFVARFIGEANLIEARVESRIGDMARLRAGELAMTVKAVNDVAVGADVLASLRPETVQPDADANCVNSFPAEALSAQYLGSVSLWTIRVAGHVLKMQVQNAPGAAQLAPGAAFRVGWSAEACCVLHE